MGFGGRNSFVPKIIYSLMDDLPDPSSKKVALVTGGYKKIGLEISKALKDMGYNVIATYRSDPDIALKASEEIGFEVLHADMSKEEDVKDLFSNLRSRGVFVSVLVNNVSSFPRGPLIGMDPHEFRQAFESCVYSSFYSINEAVKDMRRNVGGSIINIGMAGTQDVKGYIDVAAHASAKTALAVLSMSLGRELEDEDISVDLVSPGLVDDPERDDDWRERMRRISPSGDLVSRTDIARAVITLLKDRKIGGRIVEII